MLLSKQSDSSLQKTIETMVKQFVTTETTTITDFHFHVNIENGYMEIFDDNDNTLASAHISEWENMNQENCYDEIETVLRGKLTEMQKAGVLDNMNILKPYSCLLVDDDKETIVDLLYVDDDTFIINDDLMKDFDKEMDEFLKKLLEE